MEMVLLQQDRVTFNGAVERHRIQISISGNKYHHLKDNHTLFCLSVCLSLSLSVALSLSLSLSVSLYLSHSLSSYSLVPIFTVTLYIWLLGASLELLIKMYKKVEQIFALV